MVCQGLYSKLRDASLFQEWLGIIYIVLLIHQNKHGDFVSLSDDNALHGSPPSQPCLYKFRIPRSTMLRAYGKAFQTDPILSELEKIWNDTEELRDIRNILTHRAVGARDLMATTGPSAPPDRIPRLNISLDAGTTRTHRSRVAGLLLLGLEGADKFVKAHGPG